MQMAKNKNNQKHFHWQEQQKIASKRTFKEEKLARKIFRPHKAFDPQQAWQQLFISNYWVFNFVPESHYYSVILFLLLNINSQVLAQNFHQVDYPEPNSMDGMTTTYDSHHVGVQSTQSEILKELLDIKTIVDPALKDSPGAKVGCEKIKKQIIQTTIDFPVTLGPISYTLEQPGFRLFCTDHNTLGKAKMGEFNLKDKSIAYAYDSNLQENTLHHEAIHAENYYLHQTPACKISGEYNEESMVPVYPVTSETMQAYHKAFEIGDQRTKDFKLLREKEINKIKLTPDEKNLLKKYTEASQGCFDTNTPWTFPINKDLYTKLISMGRKDNVPTNDAMLQVGNGHLLKNRRIWRENDNYYAELYFVDSAQAMSFKGILMPEKLAHPAYKDRSEEVKLAERETHTFSGLTETALKVFYPEAHALRQELIKKCKPSSNADLEEIKTLLDEKMVVKSTNEEDRLNGERVKDRIMETAVALPASRPHIKDTLKQNNFRLFCGGDKSSQNQSDKTQFRTDLQAISIDDNEKNLAPSLIHETFIYSATFFSHQGKCKAESPSAAIVPAFPANEENIKAYNRALDAGDARIKEFETLLKKETTGKVISKTEKNLLSTYRKASQNCLVSTFIAPLTETKPGFITNAVAKIKGRKQSRSSASIIQTDAMGMVDIQDIQYDSQTNAYFGKMRPLDPAFSVAATVNTVTADLKALNKVTPGIRLAKRHAVTIKNLSDEALAVFYPELVKLEREHSAECEPSSSKENRMG